MKSEGDKMPAIERAIAQLGRLEARVGVMGKSGAASGDPRFGMAELAFVHEFGSPAAGVPQRSFIRSAFEGEKRAALKRLAARAADAVVTGKVSPDDAVALLGEWGVARVRENMVNGIAPPLAASTMEKRKRIQPGKTGSDKPLLNTGRLRQAVTYEVGEK